MWELSFLSKKCLFILMCIVFLCPELHPAIESVFGSRKTEGSTSGDSRSIRLFGSERGRSSGHSTHGSASKSVFSSKRKYKKLVRKRIYVPSGEFAWPAVPAAKITSKYGWRSGSRFHDGIDISAPEGSNVYASKAGVVIYSGHRIRGYGLMIVIKHSHDLYTVYAHNKVNKVKVGERVRQNQIIALLGRTGNATGPHLHFEIRRKKYSVDPLKYLGIDRKGLNVARR
jgi:murein DD-endopeptidase MepM/ murein hydrolase activator NlpD